MRLPIDVSLPLSATASFSKNSPFVLLEGEPVLLELQGTLETPDASSAADRAGHRIGKLDLSNPVRCISLVCRGVLNGTFTDTADLVDFASSAHGQD